MTNLFLRFFCCFDKATTTPETNIDVVPPLPPLIRIPTPTPSIKKLLRKRISSSRTTTEAAPPVAGKKWRILVVDDSAVCRKSTARILKLHNHFVDEADDGVECIFMIQLAADYNEEPYDAMICDDDMPVLNGADATKMLRAKGFDNLKIVGLTGNRNDERLQDFRDAGADIVIRKPLTAAIWLRIYNSFINETSFSLAGTNSIC
jgi:CheY-like chemotaxis protein